MQPYKLWEPKDCTNADDVKAIDKYYKKHERLWEQIEVQLVNQKVQSTASKHPDKREHIYG